MSKQMSTLVTDRELGLISAIRTVMLEAKNLSCRWHINKNLVAKAKKHFQTEETWTSFIQEWDATITMVQTKEWFWEKMGRLKVMNPAAFAYLESAWLQYVEMFAAYAVDEVMHFGINTTSRVEGSHATLKAQLRASIGNIVTISESVELVINIQLHEIQTELRRNQISSTHCHDGEFLLSDL